MSFFEALMLICFGAAWPVSIYRSYKSRVTSGKSIGFLIIIEVGYLSGIAYKVSSNLDHVVWLYVLNAVMVLVDIGLYRRNYRLERQ
ncbi:MAG TPA: hypothetical protein ENH94_11085 [Phycisphaerales bacterium]|nr:hypothetical protein [Phycisphaerales bacterium]